MRQDRPAPSGRLPFPKRLFILAWLIVSAAPLRAETIILEVLLNTQNKGEYFVELTDSGEVLMTRGDLAALNLTLPPGATLEKDGQRYRSLSAVAELEVSIDFERLTLAIDAPPSMLPKSDINLLSPQRTRIHYPSDDSLFLNYALEYLDAGQEGSQGLNLTNQFGWRRGDALFLTDTAYTGSSSPARFNRLNSSLTIEKRTRLVRWTIGDLAASSGPLGSTVNLAGVGYAKRFSIDPYFIEYPTSSFSGSLPLPSQVEIYQNGIKQETLRLPPGPFEIDHLSRRTGAGQLELVITDPYGEQRRVVHRYYLAEQLLKRGIDEYSYNIGLERESFGTASFDYGEPVVSAFHRRGFTDELTLGLAAEGGKSIFNLGMGASWAPRAAGLFEGQFGGSFGGEQSGVAGLVRYGYSGDRFSTHLRSAFFSSGYSTLATAPAPVERRYEIGGSVAYGSRGFGSVDFDLSLAGDRDGRDRKSASVIYSRSLAGNRASLFVSLQQLWEAGRSETNALFTLSYYPRPAHQVGLQLEKQGQSTTSSLQYQKNPPLGTGYGYDAVIEHTASGEGEGSTTLNPSFEYRTVHNVFRGQGWYDQAESRSNLRYRLSAAGGIVYLGDALAFSRPIRDSFALVKVGDLEGVRVYHNAQEMGRTDREGRLIVPEMKSYFENQIAIDDQDIPIDYSFSSLDLLVSPPLRSGSCLIFEATAFQPTVGRLFLAGQGKVEPLEFVEITVTDGSRTLSIPTGKGGEFYFDPTEMAGGQSSPTDAIMGCEELKGGEEALDAKPADYIGTVRLGEREYSFSIDIPQSEDLFVDLGRITIGPDAQ